MFGMILISVTTLMHLYVFWRISSLTLVRKHCSRSLVAVIATGLWIIFLLGRVIGHEQTNAIAAILEFFGMTWMAVLFLLFFPLLLVDLITLFGLILPRLSVRLRATAVICGMVFSGVALFQGLRSPVITEYEVTLPDLPQTMNQTVLVAISDMHLGSQLGKSWLQDRVTQVNKLQPDLIVLLGDIFEGHGAPDAELMAVFKQLTAPLGVWAVAGNHEFHSSGNTKALEKSGFRMLKNEWVQVQPGFILSGVEDLTNWSRNGHDGDPISQALTDRPQGMTVFLSHTPWEAEKVSRAGAGLMLSGHTHGGQIWPFDHLVANNYPLMEGAYDINGMTVIVSRGTGTWGPRMRLWQPSEILRIVLKRSS